MALSLFDTIMIESGIPALEAVFGVTAIHYRQSDSEELTVTVILQQQVLPIGEFGERLEKQWTLEIAASSLAEVGDEFEVDATTWKATQLISDDGYMRKFAVLDTAT